MKIRSFGIPAILVIIGLIVGLTLSSNLNIQKFAHSSDTRKEISAGALSTLSGVSDAMVELVGYAKPAVVNISTVRKVKVAGGTGGMNPFFDDPFFRRFFGEDFMQPFQQQPRERNESALGSGVIVEVGSKKYIITNNHVVRDASEIKVTLSDERELKGKVLGTDPKTDIAVISIEGSDNLPVLKWGDSNKLRVGELVIAVGSPFGLNQTVTSGIVSAKGRANVRIADYEDFIQTDAAINPGNSGGPLINIRGELVGINTAIFSTSGGYQGIGFAIPSNMVLSVIESLVKDGKVVRGWLGVTIQPLTKELSDQFGIKGEKGVIVSDLMDEGPAEKAGLKVGDIITHFDGKPVEDPTALRTTVAATAPGKEIPVKIIRDGKPMEITVRVGELPDETARAQGAPGHMDNALKHVQVQNLTPEIKEKLGMPKKLKGVVVTDGGGDSRLKAGDVIMEINRKQVTNTKEYYSVAGGIKRGSDILLRLYRDGGTLYMLIPAEGE